jgi:hypothetical protein
MHQGEIGGGQMTYHNSEGYPDPTAGQALAQIAREERAYKPLVYIASPFAGDTTGNIERAKSYCRFAVGKGCIPLAPHLHYPRFLDDGNKQERELGLFAALILLTKCDALWVFGDAVTEGMSREIAKAEKRGMPIRYFNNKLEEVFSHA